MVHVHSDYSHDGVDTLEMLRDWATQRGVAFIALSDHAEDFSPERWEDFVLHCADLSDERVRLIPGLEFRFAGHTGLHLLALGLERWISPKTPEEFIAQSRNATPLTVLAHPRLCRYRIPDCVRAEIGAIEVWNAGYDTRYLPDVRSIRILHDIRRSRASVVGTAGLDQHDSRNDRQTRVVVEDGGDPLACLRAGRFVNVGRTMRFDSHVTIGSRRLAALAVARWSLDRVERTQERVVRALRRVTR